MQKLQQFSLFAFCLVVLLGCLPPPAVERPAAGSARLDNEDVEIEADADTAVEVADESATQADVTNEEASVVIVAEPVSIVEAVDETAVQAETADVETAVESNGENTSLIEALAGGCRTDLFLDVEAHPSNANYPDPELHVNCDGQFMVVETNNIPNFEFVSTTPNALEAHDLTFNIPLNPTPSSDPEEIPLGGVTAVMVNGVVVFGPTESGRHNYRDPYLDGILDYCNGHTAPSGAYHYHAVGQCIFAEYEGNVGLVVAYSFDGYPILAPYLCDDESCATVQELQSSWQLTDPSEEHAWLQHSYVAGSGDLDECNGMLFDDGSYAYFATETFPYFMGCYYGESESSNFRSGRGGNGGENGNRNGNDGGRGQGQGGNP